MCCVITLSTISIEADFEALTCATFMNLFNHIKEKYDEISSIYSRDLKSKFFFTSQMIKIMKGGRTITPLLAGIGLTKLPGRRCEDQELEYVFSRDLWSYKSACDLLPNLVKEMLSKRFEI